MALWKDSSAKPAQTPDRARFEVRDEPAPTPEVMSMSSSAESARNESVIAAELSIEGKIQGSGHIRLAGKFKGDVDVQGDLTIESGASLTGGIRAKKVSIAGEVQGNIEATSVELLKSGVMNGDLKATTLSVAAGSRMRGQVEFGWNESGSAAPRRPLRPDAGGESSASP